MSLISSLARAASADKLCVGRVARHSRNRHPPRLWLAQRLTATILSAPWEFGVGDERVIQPCLVDAVVWLFGS